MYQLKYVDAFGPTVCLFFCATGRNSLEDVSEIPFGLFLHTKVLHPWLGSSGTAAHVYGALKTSVSPPSAKGLSAESKKGKPTFRSTTVTAREDGWLVALKKEQNLISLVQLGYCHWGKKQNNPWQPSLWQNQCPCQKWCFLGSGCLYWMVYFIYLIRFIYHPSGRCLLGS